MVLYAPLFWIAFLSTAVKLVIAESNANPQILVRDGAANGIMGWPGLVYQAARFEPLCGNLGTDTRYKDVIDISERCTSAIKNGVVGNGQEACLCFALSGSSFNGGFCWWVDGAGRGDGWWHSSYDRILSGSYRPNIAKAMPKCKDVDVDGLKQSWSATAVQPTANVATKTSTSCKSYLPI
jgi:hypothetical protein